MKSSKSKSKHSKPNKMIRFKRSNAPASTSSELEGTFLPISSDSDVWEGPKFVNPKFREIEEDAENGELVKIEDYESDEKPPLLLLFPELQDEADFVQKNMSTTDLTRHLVGKTADFSLLKPSRKLQPFQKKHLPAVPESILEEEEEETAQQSLEMTSSTLLETNESLIV